MLFWLFVFVFVVSFVFLVYLFLLFRIFFVSCFCFCCFECFYGVVLFFVDVCLLFLPDLCISLKDDGLVTLVLSLELMPVWAKLLAKELNTIGLLDQWG